MVWIIVINLPVYAQMVNMHANTGAVMKVKKYVGIDGSPYLDPEWKSGTFTDIDGKNRGSFKMRYNIFDDELEIIRDEKAISLNHQLVKEFELINPESENKYLFRSGYAANGEYGQENFYRVLYDQGNFHLLKKYHCNITTIENKGYGDSNEVQKFLQSSKYYLFSDNAGFKKINKSKKSILEAFPDHEKEIKAYIKSNKINVKNDNDLARLIKFCNSIN